MDEQAVTTAPPSLRDRLKVLRPKELYEIPGGDGEKLEIRSMTVGQRRTWVERSRQAAKGAKEASDVDPDVAQGLVELVFSYVTFDPATGERMYQDDDPAIRDLDSQLVDNVATRGLELSGINLQAHQNAKNSSAVSSDSPSSSPNALEA